MIIKNIETNYNFWILDKQTYLSFNCNYNFKHLYYYYLNNNNINIKFNIYYLQFKKLKKYNKKFFKILLNFNFNYIFTEIILKFTGLGYFIKIISPHILQINIGYSHKIYIKIPKLILYKINFDNSTVSFFSYNLFLLKHFIAKLILLKKSDPYKNKGINYIYKKFKPKILNK